MVLLIALPYAARADSTIYLDFDGFDLDDFAAHNATCTDQDLVEDLIVMAVARDYAAFEVHVTRDEPQRGRFTRVDIGGTDTPDPDFFGLTSDGEDWLTQRVTEAQVFPETFADQGVLNTGAWQGNNGTCTRIARALAATASHETGHVMWLDHYMAYNDCPAGGSGSDSDVNRHIMASGTSTGLSNTERATIDRFFNPNCESWILAEEVKIRGYHQQLPELIGSAGWTDLLRADVQSVGSSHIVGYRSYQTYFGSGTTYSSDIGGAIGRYLTLDYDGDGDDDVLHGDDYTGSTLYWQLHKNNGSGTLTYDHALGAVGEEGDIFRTGDVNGDGREDLIRGQFTTTSTTSPISWYVKTRGTIAWSSETLFCTGCGDGSNLFFTGDLDDDGDSDLVYADPDGIFTDLDLRLHPGCSSDACDTPLYMNWFARLSSGTSFGSANDVTPVYYYEGFRTSHFLLANVDSDDDPDLSYGTITPSTSPASSPHWVRHLTNNSTQDFGQGWTMRSTTGGRSSAYRAADVDGDGVLDLAYGTRSETSTTWSVHIGDGYGLSLGSSSTFLSNSGGEGMMYP